MTDEMRKGREETMHDSGLTQSRSSAKTSTRVLRAMTASSDIARNGHSSVPTAVDASFAMRS